MAADNRTEKPTSKKRGDARKKGQFARSKEMAAALVFGAVFLYMNWNGFAVLEQAKSVCREFLSHFLTIEITPLTARQLLWQSAWSVTKLAAPILFLVAISALAARALQGNLVVTTEALKFKPNSFNPASNAKKIFSPRGAAELAKALALVLILGWLSVNVLRDRVPSFLQLAAMDIPAILSVFAGVLYQVCFRVAVFLLLVAAADYGFQKYRFEEDLKQTKEEVKDDMKQAEGDPLVKRRIRRQQMEMARKRMIGAVKEADVVITNPSHYAVALKYQLQSMSAPRVVAKGQRYLALRIKEVAAEHEVPIVENPPLARALYQSVEVDEQIPEELYKAVAQILAYVYRQKESVSY
ncbi:MAG: flagellar biosynthesis protein FlhB [Acidobacteriota bacterium]